MVKIIGIDPGLAATGIGVLRGEGFHVYEYAFGSIYTTPRSPLPERLQKIYIQLMAVIERNQPDLMVVEDVFFLPRNPKSGITLGQVSGVIQLAGCQARLPVIEIAVREAKKVLTGNGAAGKPQLEAAVRRKLQLKEPIRPFHASDALALALIGLFRCLPGAAGF